MNWDPLSLPFMERTKNIMLLQYYIFGQKKDHKSHKNGKFSDLIMLLVVQIRNMNNNDEDL